MINILSRKKQNRYLNLDEIQLNPIIAGHVTPAIIACHNHHSCLWHLHSSELGQKKTNGIPQEAHFPGETHVVDHET